MPLKEEWRVVPGFPDYAVSEFGKVKRITKAQGTRPSYLLSPGKRDKYDYYTLTSPEKEQVSIFGHRLVALAFLGPPPTNKHETAHKDGVHRNNHYTNLKWSTHKENMDDRVTHKNINQYSKELTPEQRELYRLAHCGLVHSEESKRKQSRAMIEYRRLHPNPMLGRKQTPKARQRMRDGHKRRRENKL